MLMPNSIFPVVLLVLPMMSFTMSQVEIRLTSVIPSGFQPMRSQAAQEPANSEFFHRGSGRCEALQCP